MVRDAVFQFFAGSELADAGGGWTGGPGERALLKRRSAEGVAVRVAVALRSEGLVWVAGAGAGGDFAVGADEGAALFGFVGADEGLH